MSELLVDPSAPVTVTIDGSPHRYQVRVPDVLEQSLFERSVRRAGGRQWTVPQLLDTMEDAAREVLADDPDTLARVLGEIAERRARLAEFNRALLAGELVDGQAFQAAVAQANRTSAFYQLWEQRLADRSELLADRFSDNAAYDAIRATVACRLFLVGWEGHDRPFARTRDAIPEHLFRQIPPLHRLIIAQKVVALMGPDAQQGNSSGSPSGQPSGPEPSTSPSTAPTTPGAATPSA